MTVNIGQPPFSAIMIKRQLLVIEAKQVEDRCVKVVDTRDVLLRFVAELVG